ncbi:hypothetical protein [Nocardia donostiensis]|uniref:hypothetical protein n=1 Tax=Nocardia donostiensis TaxID=1538463 RepID=UPI001FE478AD|nr:hypothetical protein [Nocardia donostiensis]
MAISIALLGNVPAGGFTANMPVDAPAAAHESIGPAFALGYAEPAKAAFAEAMSTGAWISAGFVVAAAALGLVLLRTRPRAAAEPEPVTVG